MRKMTTDITIDLKKHNIDMVIKLQAYHKGFVNYVDMTNSVSLKAKITSHCISVLDNDSLGFMSTGESHQKLWNIINNDMFKNEVVFDESTDDNEAYFIAHKNCEKAKNDFINLLCYELLDIVINTFGEE